MYLPRVIPCLLLKNGLLYKGQKFSNPKYVGDPINTVRIFNEKEVDEIVFLDITATREGKEPNLEHLRDIAGECFMPLAYGGGIKNLEQMKSIFEAGAEKVILNTAAFEKPQLVEEASQIFGSQSIVVSIDVKRSAFGKYEVFTNSGTKKTKADPLSYAKKIESLGAGEILLTSIDHEGCMKGYDLKLLKKIAQAVSIPVVASGGAGAISDFSAAINRGGASAVSAGSMFVFQGKHRAVLISYPSAEKVHHAINSPA